VRRALLLALLATSAACSGRDRPPPAARHLVLLSLDTLRPDHTGAYGYPRPTSPHLDRLARESVLLARMRSHAPETYDAHMAFFTGQYPFVNQRVGGLPMLAELLGEAGFATAGFTDGGQLSRSFGFDRGFQLYADHGGGLRKHVEAMERWLDERKPERFFVFLHTYEIHDPYNPGRPYNRLYFPEYAGRIRGPHTQPILRAIRQIHGSAGAPGEIPILDEADRRQIVALYDGGIRRTDEDVGRLYELLRRRGLLDETLFVVVSDHGDELWEHGSVLHSHTLYQELLEIAGIVRMPGGLAGGEIRDGLVQGIDLAPTLLRALGAGALPTAAGRPLELLESFAGQPWYAEKRMNFSLQQGRYKYIGDLEGQRPLLFDLAADPRESEPLADPERESRMLEAIGAVRTRIKEDLARYRQQYPPPPPREMDEQTLEQLRRLGYIE
jgi:arylsulfatase A-like enzyme